MLFRSPRFPKATHGIKKELISVEQVLNDLQTKSGKIYNHEVDKSQLSNLLDKKRLKHIPTGSGIRYQRDEKAFLPKKLRFDVDWENMNENRFRQTRLQRLPMTEPAPTILTSRTMYYHPFECRYLTVREAARLQSFPNTFIFEGSVTAQFKQIGNSVPPQLAKSLGKELKKIEFNLAKVSKISFKNKPSFTKSAFTYKKPKTA